MSPLGTKWSCGDLQEQMQCGQTSRGQPVREQAWRRLLGKTIVYRISAADVVIEAVVLVVRASKAVWQWMGCQSTREAVRGVAIVYRAEDGVGVTIATVMLGWSRVLHEFSVQVMS